jgi:transposase
MAKTRRTYTPEFKAEAVKLVTEQGYSVAEAARSLGLDDNLTRDWKQSSKSRAKTPSPAAASSPPSRK